MYLVSVLLGETNSRGARGGLFSFVGVWRKYVENDG